MDRFQEPVNKRDMLIAVAKMYYIEGLSQQEIADRINQSRSNVSRMLKICVDEKVVEFKINDTSSVALELQNSIKQMFGLKEVIIVPTNPSPDQNKINLGETAARYLDGILNMGMLLGVGWGTTIYHIAKAVNAASTKRVDVIQLVGGVGAKSIDTDGHEIVKTFAKALNGNAYILQAPLFVQSKVLKDMLMQEPNIAEHFRRINEVDVAVIGMGGVHPSQSALCRAGFITQDEAKKLIEEGVTADVCGTQLDIEGRRIALHTSDRVIAISYDQLKNIKFVVGVAVGVDKTDAILASLRGKMINVLIIDEAAAFSVLSRVVSQT